MQEKTAQRTRLGVFAALCALALAAALCALACPIQAFADERIGHSVDASGNVTDYYDIASARAACYAGTTVVMDADWKFEKEDHFVVPNGKKVTLDMNGHRIDSNYLAFFLNEHSELVLTSSVKNTFTYKGYSPQDGSEMDVQTTTGGLVKVTDNFSSAIQGSDNCTVTLDGVTLGGSRVTQDIRTTHNGIGGVYLTDNSTLNMKNGASIEHNKAHKGAGVYAASTDITINMENSSISDNYALETGGGILCDEKRAHINMAKGAKVSGNTAAYAGGGIYFRYSDFSLKSEDRDAFVSGNRCLESSRTTKKELQSGGGIHVDQREFESNEGLIEGITISDNYSAYDAGGIELDQEWTTVRDCTITGNWCKYEGGGIYVCNDRNTIDNCTITGNACSVDSGGNYEGGGVFVWHDYDIKMIGKCIVKGNTRGKGSGNADDVMLRENGGATAKAYITGSLSEGSSVGVRTGITGDRRVAKNFKPVSKDCLFYDLDGYYISYGSDEGGDAWQRHTTREFLAQVNGEGSNRYKWNSPVTLVAPLAKGDDQVFWYWDAKSTSGLNPVDDYITNKNALNNALAFKMPQNDVDAAALYATKVKNPIVGIETPEANKPLPSVAQVRRGDSGIGGHQWLYAAVTWYEVSDDGTKTLASGTAKPETSYAASVACTQYPGYGLCFSQSIRAEDVRVATTSGSAPSAESVSVDALTGALTVQTAAFAKTGGGDPAQEASTVSVELQNGGLEAAVGVASDSSSISLVDDGASEALSSRPVIGKFDVSYSKDSATVAVSAPAVAGYNFCNWENVDDGWISDDVDEVVSVPVEDLDRIDKLVAVYTPVVTEVEVGMGAPAAGVDLAKAVTSLKLKGYDGSTIDLVDAIGKGPLPVSWSPADEDGKADYSTAYSAVVSLAAGEGFEGVDKVLAQGAAVKASDGTQATSAGFAVVEDGLSLCLAFPETDAIKATNVSQPADVELTFERALACQENQEAHPGENCWPLPKTVTVTLENGEAVDGDVTWDIPSGFDSDATTSQEIAVKGKVHVAFIDEVDTSGVSLDVSTTVKIAAPSQGGGEDGGETPAANPDDGNGEPAADADGKSALAKTGDSIPVFAVAAVVVIAVAAVAVAIVAARRRRQ